MSWARPRAPGVYGVSDTFATALWATDALFNMLARRASTG